MTESASLASSIAITGLAGRFPGARNVAEFWQNLVAGKNFITQLSDAQLAASGYNPAKTRALPGYVAARGLIEKPEWFDAAFFGISPKEAEVMDPQQRLFLEIAWDALEDAGCDPSRYPGLIGVFGGLTNNTYYQHFVRHRRDLLEAVGTATAVLANEKDFLATRLAYRLDLRGPALNIQTACSSSLVAVSVAAQSLLNFQCDAAIAGGVSITFPQERGYFYNEGAMTSPDGRCAPFDATASGTVFSSGAGVVILKRLADALAEGDQIYAVIRGTALNNDGGKKVSFAAPSVDGHSEVIALAQAVAGVTPDTISYIETHGTGTPLGDPIEIAGLTQVFRTATDAKQTMPIGSVKGNIGHLDAASGVVGLIKTALALQHGQIPPSLHFNTANPALHLEDSPFFVNTKLREWPRTTAPRRAGVSSFGVGGTNAHVVLEEAPYRVDDALNGEHTRPRVSASATPPKPNETVNADSATNAPEQIGEGADLRTRGRMRSLLDSEDRAVPHLLVLSAKTATALDRRAEDLAAHLEANPNLSLADVAYTLQVGRQRFTHRRAIVARTVAEAVDALRKPTRAQRQDDRQDTRVALLFPGQGAQYAKMGAQLYRTECAFRDAIDEVATTLQPELGLDLRELLFSTEPEAAERLRETRVTQPTIFALDYAIGRLWLSLGVEPAALLGHSVGEFAAAALAGVFSVADAAKLVATRARLVNELPAGAMLAVRVGEAEARELLNAELSLAAINSPKLCVISGPLDAIAQLEATCEERKIAARRLATSHAFHSAMVEPVIETFAAAVAAVKLSAPTLPIVSSATGDWLTDAQATDPRYWAAHLRATVRFADGVGRLLDEQGFTLLEAGPGQALTLLARQHAAHAPRHAVVHTIAEDTDDEVSFASAVAQLWLAGAPIDWSRVHGSDVRRRISIPSYPFERQRYFADLPAHLRPPYATNITDGEPPLEEEAASHALGNGEHTRPRVSAAAPSPQPSLTEDAPRADGIGGGADPDTRGRECSPAHSEEVAALSVPMLEQIRAIFSDLSGQDLIGAPADMGFLELGFDSLFLSQAAITLTRKFGCKVTFRQLLKELSNLQALADFVDANATKRDGAAPAAATAPVQAAQPATTSGAPAVHGPFRPVVRELSTALTAKQEQWIQDFIVRYVARTPKSKQHTQEFRKVLADPRAVSGFKQVWKEMIYPIVVDRSKGAKLWDIDGNEWLDITLAFGAAMLGHQPDFVIEACKKQMDLGIEIGPTSPLAGEVAQLLCDRTGMDRVTFCNTGSEAVTGALRVARTVTGRPLIVYFSGGYHGIDNEALGHRTNSDAAVPIAPGIMPEALANTLIFDYGDPRALEQIAARADDIAAVLVEPVQSRRPGFQPREFLHELRAITQQNGIALIFDEVVTGFRCHPGGAQAYFGIKADLASYGKILGGGISIGAIAGRAEYMDAFDGGQWQFGDDSFPEAAVTFFAGTFVRWPLALAAAKAVLLHLEKEGPALQQTIAARADALMVRIAEIFDGTPFTARNFTSNWYVTIAPEFKYGPIFYALLRLRGIHVWEGRPIFVSTEHTQADLDRVVEAFRGAVAELEDAEFFVRKKNDAPAGSDSFPISEGQREMWLVCQQDPIGSVAYNETWTLRLTGEFDLAAFRAAAQMVVDRHDALRATVTPSGELLVIAAQLDLEVPLIDLSTLSAADRDTRFAALREAESTRVFDLQRGPLIAFQIVKLGEREHAFLFNAHHLTCDGWSCDVLLNELAAIYTARRNGTPHGLPVPMQMRDYETWEVAMREGSEFAEDKAYWLDQYTTIPPELTLPGDRPHPRRRSYRGSAEEITLPAEWMAPIAKLGSDHGATFFAALLAGFKTLLFRLTGNTDLAVGMPSAGQNLVEGENLIGHCVNLLPVRTQFRADSTFAELLKAVQTAVLEGFEHQRLTFGTLLQSLSMTRTPGRVPLVPVTFNLDPPLSHIAFAGLEYQFENNPRAAFQFDFGFNCDTSGGGFRIVCKYSTDLFDAATVRRWMDHFREVLETAAANPQQPLSAFLPQLGGGAKIAGRDIDLLAVEDALKKLSAVKDAAVVVHESANGDPEIVAHVVPGEFTPVMCWVSSPSAGGELFYDDVLYNAMAHDKSRHDLYRRAFAQTVKDKVVVDVGTGRDAILARFCIEAGAKRVYGIEILEKPAEQARQLVEKLGLADRITIICGRSQDVQIPELADICISENVGHIGGAEGGDLMIIDSRRFLKPGGRIVPERCATKIAAVTMPEEFLESPGFETLGAHYARMAWESAGYKYDMRLGVMGTDRSFLASNEAVFEAIDFNQPPVAEYEFELTLTIIRDGRVDGFLLWLRLESAPGIFLEGIDAQDAWLPIFMPAFDQGVELRAGDTILAIASGKLAANKTNRDYRIRGHVQRQDGTRIAFDYDSPHYREVYRHVPFYDRLFATGTIPVTTKKEGDAERAIGRALKSLLPPGTPARIALRDALPTTAAGALDRQSLIAARRGLSDADRQRVLVEWNNTARPFPADRGIHQLFEEQAVRRPDAVAIVDGPTRVTYQELNERANRLARRLVELGVVRGTCVGICAERSPDFLTGILAIAKAGGAYVPLDPTYPADRIAQMLTATRAPLVLTRGNATAALASSGARLISFESLDLTAGDPSNLAEPCTGEDLAFVVFTSGSTGTPKAVAIAHRGISRLVMNTAPAPLTPRDVVAFAANLCFDASTWEIWAPLLNGATLVVTPHDILLAPAALRTHLAAHGITTLFLTTALFNRLAQEAPEIFRGLRYLLWGGEAADPASVRRVLERGRPQHLQHFYGPAEATTYATWHEVESLEGHVVPIGRAVSNTEVFLLDPQLQPVALGEPGEICIGGPGLALGYLHQPEFTAERFVATEFGRLYRSGDLARWLPGGALEFIGRADDQVKLRGFRIEPGEIENALRAHPTVAEARVIVRQHASAGKQLAAYVTARRGASVLLADVRAFLEQRLPDFMVPSAFAVLAHLPLTPNGKLDLHALPEPTVIGDAPTDAVAPRDAVEISLAALWHEVLGRASLSIHDDFFLVGGHSILAIRLLGRIREKLSVDVPVARLFETPTIAGLGEYISEHLPTMTPGSAASLVMIQKGDAARRPLYLVPGGWGGEIEFLVYAELVRNMDRSLPLYGLRARAANAEPLPNKTVEEFAAGFCDDIMRFQPQGPYMLGGECVGGVMAYEMARQLEARGQKVSLVLLLDTEWPSAAGLQQFNEWESARHEQEAQQHHRTLGQHVAEARRQSPFGMLRYAWRHFRPGALERKMAGFVAERACFTSWPRRLFDYPLTPHTGRITLLQDEVNSRTPMLARWQQHHAGEIDVHVVTGDHASYIREHAAEAAAKIREIIELASAPAHAYRD